MKKIILFFGLLAAISCGKKSEVSSTDMAVDSVKTETMIVVDSIKEPVVGADSDSHGCKASAGYTWSELKQKCIRIFEEGTKLSAYESQNQSAELAAFVIFESNGNKAELFLPNEKPIILERKSEGDQFVNGDWQLIPWKGYVLKKGAVILYTGQ